MGKAKACVSIVQIAFNTYKYVPLLVLLEHYGYKIARMHQK